MASDIKTVAFLADQSGLGSRLAYKRMFGEYALYLNGKVVAFVCDNKLFLKPTDAGRALLGSPTEAPAYPGSKNYFLLELELDDPVLLRKAFEVTESVLPLPKPRAAAKKKIVKPGRPAKASRAPSPSLKPSDMDRSPAARACLVHAHAPHCGPGTRRPATA